MNLPNIFSNDDHTSHLFFAIQIGEGHVEAALWKVDGGVVEVLTISEKHVWQEQDEESCVIATDKSLQELGKQSENVKQTLFALESDWVDANGIVAAKKGLFHKMTQELSLEPMGFVVTIEALTQHLLVDSPQMSVFLIEANVQHLAVTLVKSGQIISTERVGRSGESVSDLTEAFAHFSEKVFPSKMLLFSTILSQEELNEIQQQLIGYTWTEKYPFLHAPIIEIFQEDSLLEIMVQTGGIAVAEAKGLLSEGGADGNGTKAQESSIDKKNDADTPAGMATNIEHVWAEEFGFAETKVPAQAVSPAEPDPMDSVVPAMSAAAMETEKTAIAAPAISAVSKPAEEFAVETPVTVKKTEAAAVNTSKNLSDENFDESSIEEMNGPAKTARTFWQAHLRFLILGVLSGILILLGVGFWSAHTITKAIVAIKLNTLPISKDVQLTVDSKITQSDPANLRLKADVVTKDEEGDKTADTTGNKLVGDKAKGSVTIYNYTNNQKTFAAGTKLSSGKLLYTLDQSVTVASASTSIDSSSNMLTKPGTSDGSMTASVIGEDSNIGAATQLTVESFGTATYLAKTTTAIAGGSSRESQAVSQKDMDTLTSALKNELTAKAIQEFQSDTSSGVRAVPTGKIKVISSQFDGKLGDEANTLSLHLKVEVEALAYQSTDLQPLAQTVLSQEVPAGYALSQTPPQILSAPAASPVLQSAGTASSSATPASNAILLQANLSSTAIPVVDANEWKSEIAGKSVTVAENALKAKPAVSSVTISLEPQLFAFFFHTLPSSQDKITLEY